MYIINIKCALVSLGYAEIYLLWGDVHTVHSQGGMGGVCLGIRVIREASLSEQCFLAYKWPLTVTAELCSMSIVAGDMCAHSQLLAHP